VMRALAAAGSRTTPFWRRRAGGEAPAPALYPCTPTPGAGPRSPRSSPPAPPILITGATGHARAGPSRDLRAPRAGHRLLSRQDMGHRRRRVRRGALGAVPPWAVSTRRLTCAWTTRSGSAIVACAKTPRDR
jgi:hypothetical protein